MYPRFCSLTCRMHPVFSFIILRVHLWFCCTLWTCTWTQGGAHAPGAPWLDPPLILDLFLTSNPTLIEKVSVLPGLSDHDIVMAEVNAKPTVMKQVPSDILLCKKADWDQLKESMREFHKVIQWISVRPCFCRYPSSVGWVCHQTPARHWHLHPSA